MAGKSIEVGARSLGGLGGNLFVGLGIVALLYFFGFILPLIYVYYSCNQEAYSQYIKGNSIFKKYTKLTWILGGTFTILMILSFIFKKNIHTGTDLTGFFIVLLPIITVIFAIFYRIDASDEIRNCKIIKKSLQNKEFVKMLRTVEKLLKETALDYGRKSKEYQIIKDEEQLKLCTFMTSLLETMDDDYREYALEIIIQEINESIDNQ